MLLSPALVPRPGDDQDACYDDVVSMVRRLRRRLRRQGGFTLIEMMICANIVGILTMMALPSFMSARDKATDNASKANLRTALASIDAYYQDHQGYSGMSLVGLQASYNQTLDVARYSLVAVTATSYCVQSPQGSGAHVWRLNGPTGRYERTNC
jgi:prepilin-type N-terminal cleavage/methylation domain-containing protein